MTNDLTYIIRAVDQATETLNDVKKSMGAMSKEGVNSTRVLNSAVGFFTQQSGEKMAGFGKTVLRTLGSFVEAGEEARRNTRALESVIRSTGGAAGVTATEVQNLATSLSQVTNFEDDAVLRGQNLLLTFTHIGKEVFPIATEAMLNMSAAMGQDVKASAIQLGKALNDPIGGIDALTRVGVAFNDQQKAMIESMVLAGDTAGAQKIILKELEVEFGGMARSTADAKTQMANSINEIKESIGKALLPALDNAAKAMLPIVQNVTTWIEKNPELVGTIAIVAGVLGSLLAVLGTLAVTIGSVVTALGVLGIGLAIGGALGLTIVGITTLVATLIQHWEGLKWMAGNAIDFIVEKATAFGTAIVETFNAAVAAIQNFIAAAKEAAAAAASAALHTATFGVLGTPSKRAGGGTINEPYTVVGENGPELISAPRGSVVSSARETRGLLGGGMPPINLNFGDVHVHNEADEDRLIQKMKDALTRIIQLQDHQAA